ncbi:hypothetical protein P5V15_009761 [Pogonomyrmex californicus]
MSYEEKPFGPWDFKKAIFSTLYQALKAIGGGVLALKGQLVKGGGYLLAGKGKVVSKAGDVITSFGKQLAASVQPKPESYYDHPPIGPPPGSDDYHEGPNDFSPHETYSVPSDDHGQGGLLIVTPTKSDLDGHNDQHTNVAVQNGPDPAKLEESFGGPTSTIKNLLNSVPKGSVGLKDQIVAGQQDSHHNNNNANLPIKYPVASYGVPDYPINTPDALGDYGQKYPAAQDGAYQRPELPILPPHHHFPNLGLDPNLSIQPDLLQQIPNIGALPPKLPHEDGGTSVYASVSVDTEPQLAPLKVSLLGGHSDSLDLPKLQPHVNFHGQPEFANYLHGSLGGPLRVPLLNPMPPAYYWQSQGSLIPTSALDTLDHFRKRNALQRRAFAKRLARYASLQKTRLHRLGLRGCVLSTSGQIQVQMAVSLRTIRTFGESHGRREGKESAKANLQDTFLSQHKRTPTSRRRIRISLRRTEFTTPKCVIQLYWVPRKTPIEQNGDLKLNLLRHSV